MVAGDVCKVVAILKLFYYDLSVSEVVAIPTPWQLNSTKVLAVTASASTRTSTSTSSRSL